MVDLPSMPISPGVFTTMKTVQRLVFVSTIAIAGPLFAFNTAKAATLVQVNTQSIVYEDGVGTQNDSPAALMQPNILVPLSLTSGLTIPSATANGQTSGVAGTLKGRTFGSASGSLANPGGASSGTSSTQVFVADQITVSSSTLVNGTPVSILFSMLVDGSLPIFESGDNPNFFGTATATFNAGTGNQSLDLLFRSDMETNYTLVGDRRQFDRLLTGTYSTTVGAVIPISYQLITQATAYSVNGQLLQALSDFGSTGLFYIDSQTPEVTLISESGHDYTAPTPVPTPALLPGLIGLGISVLRQRQKVEI
jgi:hypothetical protein